MLAGLFNKQGANKQRPLFNKQRPLLISIAVYMEISIANSTAASIVISIAIYIGWLRAKIFQNEDLSNHDLPFGRS